MVASAASEDPLDARLEAGLPGTIKVAARYVEVEIDMSQVEAVVDLG